VISEIETWKECERLAREAHLHDSLLSLSLGNIGYTYALTEEYAQAISYLKRSATVDSVVWDLKKSQRRRKRGLYRYAGVICIDSESNRILPKRPTVWRWPDLIGKAGRQSPHDFDLRGLPGRP